MAGRTTGLAPVFPAKAGAGGPVMLMTIPPGFSNRRDLSGVSAPDVPMAMP